MGVRLHQLRCSIKQLKPGIAGAGSAWLGTAMILIWPDLPTFGVWLALIAAILAALGAVWLSLSRINWALVLQCLAILLFALAAVQWRAQQALATRLPNALEGQTVSVWMQVDGLSDPSHTGWSGSARLISGPSELPHRVRWSRFLAPGQSQSEWIPGTCVEIEGVVRGVRGLSNPWGGSAESYALIEGIGARLSIRQVGRVVPVGRTLEPGFSTLSPDAQICPRSAGLRIESWRARVAQRVTQALPASDARGLLLALAIGDTREMSPQHWELHRIAGTTHLVSISGLHVTLLASLIGLVTRWVWLQLRWRGAWMGERVPARRPALITALPVALGYALLSGWGIPAQRTVLMLLVAAILLWQGRRLSALPLWCWTAAWLTVLQPWALLTSGYWLSLGAVALLMVFGRSRGEVRCGPLLTAGRAQLAISLGMMPLTAMAFQQVTWVGPLANLVALPWITGLIMPIAVFCSAWILLPVNLQSTPCIDLLLRLAHWNAELLIRALSPIESMVWAAQSVIGAPSWPAWLALICTALVLFSWRGNLTRFLPMLGLVPLLLHPGTRPPEGGFILEAPDIGQGSAIILRTRHHVLVFDTGPPLGRFSAAERVLLPALRAQRLDPVDWLFISHADNDHASGWQALLAQHRVGAVYSNDPIAMPGTVACQRGQTWMVDGLRFSILHPHTPVPSQGWPVSQRNANSCVLSVRGRWSSVLLTGDIDHRAERQLADLGLLQAHAIVVAPHHGAATSSSLDLISAVQAQHLWIQSGHQNRYGHPAPAVEQRWAASGAQVWRTDQSGALFAQSVDPLLQVSAWRLQRRRWWHTS